MKEKLSVVSCQLSQPTTDNRQLFAIAAIILTLALSPAIAHACPTCYGAPDSPLTKGSDNAMLFMLGIVGFVQAGFIGLFITFWRRARALRRRRDSFRLLDGGVQ